MALKKIQKNSTTTKSRWLFLLVGATLVVGSLGPQRVFACEVTDVELWIGNTESDAQACNTNIVYLEKGDSFGWYVEWDADTPDNNDFDIVIRDTTEGVDLDSSSANPSDRSDSATARLPSDASTGDHIIKAKICRQGLSWHWSDDPGRTLVVVIVDKVVEAETEEEGPLCVCLDSEVELEAKPDPATASFPTDSPQWKKVSYPTIPTLDPISGATTTLSGLSVVGNYVIRAKCGSSDSGADITVKALQNKFVVEAPDDVTSGEAFTVTVKAVNCENPEEIYSDYTGTIEFSTDDTASNITLPANYTFTEEDSGSHTFTNAVVLRTVSGTGHTRKIKVKDTLDDMVPGEDEVNMWFSVHATIEFYRNCPWPGGELSYGAQTACDPGGLPADSVFVALPSTTVSCGTQVIVKYGATTKTAPLRDRGPMTTGDPYWNEDGLPEHPDRAMDLSDGLASQLGISYGCSGSTPFGAADIKWRFQ